VAQGAQFIALGYLPAVTVNLLLGFSPVGVALLGGWMIGEPPRLLQWLGLAVMLGGAFLYFYPSALEAPLALPGMLAAGACVLANSLGQVWSRSINREKQLNPLAITVVTMGIGSILMLAAGIATQGLPPLTLTHWLIIGWMAAANTALGFTLWNHTMRTLSALESSVIANTMMVQVPILAIIFLGESQSPQQLLALGVAIVGVFLVQLRKQPG
jgi:drug/metabolite transporter (DMT)-like permease